MHADEVIAAVAGVELPTLGHTLEDGFVDAGIAAVGAVPKVAGRARTVDLVEPDALAVNAAILALLPGEVLVVRVASGVHAPVGAVTTAAARAQGAAGIVVDGPVTDIRVLARDAAELPVWARGTTARTTKRLGLPAQLDVPVTIGGVEVRPGDVIAADEHGVLVLDPAELEPQLFEDARASDAAEPALLARIAAGEPLATLLGVAAASAGPASTEPAATEPAATEPESTASGSSAPEPTDPERRSPQ